VLYCTGSGDDEVHPRQADFHAVDHAGDVAGIFQDLGAGVQARHLVIDHRDPDRVVAAGDVAVKHEDLLWLRPAPARSVWSPEGSRRGLELVK
jgi:hypothetical protein